MRGLGGRISAFLIKALQRFSRGQFTVHGIRCTVTPDVFNPKLYFTTPLLISSLHVGPGDRVLEMGTGSGAVAIAAARQSAEVVGVDISPAAVHCAMENARLNGTSRRVTILHGDLFSPLGGQAPFDVILFNPPYLEGKVRTPIDRAIYDPEKKLLRRFFEGAGRHLTPSGYIQMVYSSIAAPKDLLRIAAGAGYDSTVSGQKRILFERLFVFEFRKSGSGRNE
jgi:release factor glutamine methyltransferase